MCLHKVLQTKCASLLDQTCKFENYNHGGANDGWPCVARQRSNFFYLPKYIFFISRTSTSMTNDYINNLIKAIAVVDQ